MNRSILLFVSIYQSTDIWESSENLDSETELSVIEELDSFEESEISEDFKKENYDKLTEVVDWICIKSESRKYKKDLKSIFEEWFNVTIRINIFCMNKSDKDAKYNYEAIKQLFRAVCIVKNTIDDRKTIFKNMNECLEKFFYIIENNKSSTKPLYSATWGRDLTREDTEKIKEKDWFGEENLDLVIRHVQKTFVNKLLEVFINLSKDKIHDKYYIKNEINDFVEKEMKKIVNQVSFFSFFNEDQWEKIKYYKDVKKYSDILKKVFKNSKFESIEKVYYEKNIKDKCGKKHFYLMDRYRHYCKKLARRLGIFIGKIKNDEVFSKSANIDDKWIAKYYEECTSKDSNKKK